ncbi:MAG: hypothetical protein AAF762_08385 [Pseudomonadota bacterium]
MPEQTIAKLGFPSMVKKVLFDPAESDVMHAFRGDHWQHEERHGTIENRLPNHRVENDRRR